MVFEYVNGGTLGDLLDRIPFDHESNPEMSNVFAWAVFKEALEAIEFLHQEGLSHQDGHLGNFFLNYGGLKMPTFMLGDCGGSSNLSSWTARCFRGTWPKNRIWGEAGKWRSCLLRQMLSGSGEGAEDRSDPTNCRRPWLHLRNGIRTDYRQIKPVLRYGERHNRKDAYQTNRLRPRAHRSLQDLIEKLMKGDRAFWGVESRNIRRYVDFVATKRLATCRDHNWTRPEPPAAKPRVWDSRRGQWWTNSAILEVVAA